MASDPTPPDAVQVPSAAQEFFLSMALLGSLGVLTFPLTHAVLRPGGGLVEAAGAAGAGLLFFMVSARIGRGTRRWVARSEDGAALVEGLAFPWRTTSRRVVALDQVRELRLVEVRGEEDRGEDLLEARAEDGTVHLLARFPAPGPGAEAAEALATQTGLRLRREAAPMNARTAFLALTRGLTLLLSFGFLNLLASALVAAALR